MEAKPEIKEISFASLKRGSRLVVEIRSGKFEILVTGKRKNGLFVKVNTKKEEFTARMPGGFTMHEGLTPGVIRVAEVDKQNCLYFENLKDAETGEKISSKMRTRAIKSISLSS
ncbi:hypothetical protein KJ841_00135 [Patescibacteria group bacterium]|nr:hypothetical protein [Patescibacteria group bacterium]